MRKFTKSLLALALMVLSVGEVNAERVYKVVYSDYTSFPWFAMGYTPTWDGGIMVDDPATIMDEPGWHQYFVADGVPTVAGNDYIVKALVKSSANLTFNVNMGGWGDGNSVDASVTIPKSNDFVEVEWRHNSIPVTSCHITAQPWAVDVKIEWKELAVYTADPLYRPVFGDLHTVTPHMYAKNAGEGWGTSATPDGDGVYTVTSVDNARANDWDTQFWIATPEKGLPAGQKFYVEFSYKADHAANVQTQTQLEENGGYKTWHCVGEEDKQNIAFTTDWKSIKKEVNIEDDMAGWKSIAFNLNCDKTANKYYFKDIVLKVPELTGEYVDVSVGEVDWTTYSSSYNVDLGTASGYAAKYNGSYVELIPVTQVPANNAVLIEGVGKYTFDVIASATAIAENDLEVSDGSVTGDGSTIYSLANLDFGVGFYKVKSGQKVPKGKVYLSIADASAPDFLGFDGGATSISEKTVVKGQTDSVYYNLSGQRVAQPTKGLYIVNGKKVVIK